MAIIGGLAECGDSAGAIVERRRSPRLRPLLPVAEGPALADVSPYGCQIHSARSIDFRPGQFVEIDFGDDSPLRAIVRWSDAARLGLEFTRALAVARLDALLDTPGPVRLRRL